ncbi:hypothetical protein [Neobacillus drentensis]|uniref:hypothetical protein n=1 Tax=Neobacillus drentensis TaxID=220684 RepID=UPI002FFDD82B
MFKVIVDILAMLIGGEGARLLREYGTGETPQALQRRGGSPERPRTARAWSGKQRTSLTQPYLLYAQVHRRNSK